MVAGVATGTATTAGSAASSGAGATGSGASARPERPRAPSGKVARTAKARAAKAYGKPGGHGLKAGTTQEAAQGLPIDPCWKVVSRGEFQNHQIILERIWTVAHQLGQGGVECLGIGAAQ